MQDHNGAASCKDGGKVCNPCPSDTIYKMISEGTAGTHDGDGLANCINGGGRRGRGGVLSRREDI